MIAGTIHIYITAGFLLLSRVALKRLSYNAYLSLIPGVLYILPFILIAADFARLFPNENITGIFRRVLGKYFGAVFSLVFTMLVIMIVAFPLRETQIMVLTYFFHQTPGYLIAGFSMVIVLYLALNGIKSILKLAAFMLIPPLMIIYGLNLLGLMNIDWLTVQPVLSGAIGQWLTAGFDLLYLFVPTTVIFFYLPLLQNSKQVLKVEMISLGVAFPLYFLSLLGTIGTFGPSVMKKIAWPTLASVQSIGSPYLLLEQVGVLFIITWYAFVLIAVTQGVYLTSKELFNLWPVVNHKLLIVAVGVLIFIIINLPIGITMLIKMIERFQVPYIIIYYSLFVITWVVARIRIIGGKTFG